jgi:hypothetical protein
MIKGERIEVVKGMTESDIYSCAGPERNRQTRYKWMRDNRGYGATKWGTAL